MKLFIIGNGFDLAHNVKTSYGAFREYLEEQDWGYLECLENMYGICSNSTQAHRENMLWKEFENNLSNIDETTIVEIGENIELGLEGGDIYCQDTLDEYWESQYKFIEKLNEFIMLWIKQIDIDVNRSTNKIDNEMDGIFMTFNYTLLLESVYGIEESNILHIHGSVASDDANPVIGHGNKEKIAEIKDIYDSLGEYDEKRCSIYGAIIKYFERTLKNVNHFISWNNSFFRSLDKVDEIFVIGHSLGNVDMPYFKKIKNNINPNTIWNIYFFDPGEESVYKEKILSIGVHKNNIKMIQSREFFNI